MLSFMATRGAVGVCYLGKDSFPSVILEIMLTICRIWLGQGGFTYLWGFRIAKRFRLDYLYGVGVVVGGIFLSKLAATTSTPSNPTTAGPGPSNPSPGPTVISLSALTWDQVFWPSIAIVCAVVEIICICIHRNMGARDDDWDGLPRYESDWRSTARSSECQRPASDRGSSGTHNTLNSTRSSRSMKGLDEVNVETQSTGSDPTAPSQVHGARQEIMPESSNQENDSDENDTENHQSDAGELPHPDAFLDSLSFEQNPW
jgi:hypothetical protein